MRTQRLPHVLSFERKLSHGTTRANHSALRSTYLTSLKQRLTVTEDNSDLQGEREDGKRIVALIPWKECNDTAARTQQIGSSE